MQLEVHQHRLSNPRVTALTPNLDISSKIELETVTGEYLGRVIVFEVNLVGFSKGPLAVVGFSACTEGTYPLLWLRSYDIKHRPKILEVLHKDYGAVMRENQYSSKQFESRVQSTTKYSDSSLFCRGVIINNPLLSSLAKTEESMFLLQENWLGYI